MKDGLLQMHSRRKNMSKYCNNCENKGSVNSDCSICTVVENCGKEISIPSVKKIPEDKVKEEMKRDAIKKEAKKKPLAPVSK